MVVLFQIVFQGKGECLEHKAAVRTWPRYRTTANLDLALIRLLQARNDPHRRASREDAAATRNGRTSLRHNEGQDGATHFLMKTLPRVASEMALHVLAYNMTRVISLMGVRPLMAASGHSQPKIARLFKEKACQTRTPERFYTPISKADILTRPGPPRRRKDGSLYG